VLPKRFRLTRRHLFRTVMDRGHAVRKRHFMAIGLATPPGGGGTGGGREHQLRIGFVVSRKTDKRAVVRNRVRRRLREQIRLLLKEQPTLMTSVGRRCSLWVFVGRRSAATAPVAELRQDVCSLFTRAAEPGRPARQTPCLNPSTTTGGGG